MDKNFVFDVTQKYSKIIEDEEQKKQAMLDLYLDMGKFQDNSFLVTDQDKVKYFNTNYKKILFRFFTDSKTQFTSFDDFLIQFVNWLQANTFPLESHQPKQQKTPPSKQQPKPQEPKNQILRKECIAEQQKSHSTHFQKQCPPQITQTFSTTQQPKKTLNFPQKSNFPPQTSTNQLEMKMRMEKQQKIMQQKNQKDKQIIERLKEEAEAKKLLAQKYAERNNQIGSTSIQQQQRQTYVPGPSIVSQSRPSTNQLIVSGPNQGNSRGTGPSRSPTNALDRVPIYQRQQPKRQDLIKKILNRICDCYDNPEKRSKPYNQIKLQIQNLKRVQQIERTQKHFRAERNQRR